MGQRRTYKQKPILRIIVLSTVFLLFLIASVRTITDAFAAGIRTVAISDATIRVVDFTATVEFTITGAPANGMQVTLIVVKKTPTTGSTPPNEISEAGNVVYIDQVSKGNGRNSISFPISESYLGNELRAYIGGTNVSSVIFVDTTKTDGGRKGFAEAYYSLSEGAAAIVNASYPAGDTGNEFPDIPTLIDALEKRIEILKNGI